MLPEIDTQRCIISIINRCPSFVKTAWHKKLNIKDEKDRYPKFEEFSKFMSDISKKVNDPLYGNDNFYGKPTGKSSNYNN